MRSMHGIGVFICCITSSLNSAIGGPTTSPSFLLATQGTLFPSNYSDDQLAQMWPAFTHAPFEKAGFNAVSMPFHYRDPAHLGNPQEANAFAFLLSNALDWSPGCYCQRHAYFVFASNPELMQQLMTSYDPKLVSGLISGWRATHAIGGTITKSADGYSGELEIYAPDGHRAYFEMFKEPRSIFDLLGDMAASAMKFLDVPPSEALVKHLKIPRFKNPASLALLGRTAFMQRPDNIKFLDQLLAADPDFAEARCWAAEQRVWIDKNKAGEMKQYAMALDHFLTAEQLRAFVPSYLPDLPKEKVEEWWKAAAEFSPVDSPLRMVHELESMPGTKWTPELMDRAMVAAAQNPNHYWLLVDGGYMFDAPPLGRADGDMAASIYLTALQNRYQTGTGLKTRATSMFGLMMYSLGRPDITAEILLPLRAPLDEEEARPLMNSLCAIGQYQTALDFYNVQAKFLHRYAGTLATRAVFAAAMLGQADALDRIIANSRAALQQDQSLPLAQAYRDLLAGKTIDTRQLAARMPVEASHYQYLLLLAQLDIRDSKQTYRDEVSEYLSTYPSSRPGWILLDAYDRQKPQAGINDFYRTLQWLYPDDAWAVQAAADGLARNAVSPTTKPAEIIALLKDFPARHWSPRDGQGNVQQIQSLKRQITPWRVSSSLMQLTGGGDFKTAKELALRYNHLCGFGDTINLSIWANHLIYKVDECERAKK